MIDNQLKQIVNIKMIESMDQSRMKNVLDLARKNCYKAHTASFVYNLLQTRKAFELATKSYFTKDLDTKERLIFMSEVVFDNDEDFTESLKGYFTIEDLKNIDSSIEELKNSKKLNEKENLTLEQKNLLKKIEMFGINHYGLPHTFVIINKINTILALQPELLLKEKISKKQKTPHY